MKKHPFTCRQLLNRDYQKIQRQVAKYYLHNQDHRLCLKFVQALLIRRKLAAKRLSLPLVEIVKDIYFNQPVTSELAEEIYYFAEFFSPQEWHLLTMKYRQLIRLFVLVKIIGEKLINIQLSSLFLSG